MTERDARRAWIESSPSAEEAAAIVAAIERFMRAAASAGGLAPASGSSSGDAWRRAAILESVSRDPWTDAGTDADAWLGAPQ
jgi:hypothetical protein